MWSPQGQVEVMPFAAQLLQLAVPGMRCVAEGLLIQVEEQLPCPAWVHDTVSNGCVAGESETGKGPHVDRDLQQKCSDMR